MSEQTIRPYSLLIFGLQDDFIGTLKPMSLESKGHVTDPTATLKNDGTLELSFSIPMYYTESLTGERVLNPMWAATRNSELLTNLRKIKLVFPNGTKEKIFEFVIVSKEDKHTGGVLECEIKCEGLAFRELGGTGYKLSLTQEDFLAEYDKWVENGADAETEPHMNINYWCDKVFDDSTPWKYRIEMNWEAYNGNRETNKIYEDEYVSDWNINSNNQLVAANIEKAIEKYRTINCTESNRYNITQDIAEAFGVYCRYEYEYDSYYHIIGRTVVFYNNFFAEEDAPLDIIYPHQADNITRTIESSDVVTKMYVKNIDDPDQTSGIISISDTKANKSGEDYLLNFDYLKAVGSITEEQYEAVAAYEADMKACNDIITRASALIDTYTLDINEYKANLANAEEAKSQAEERVEEAKIARTALLGAETAFHIGEENGDYSISSKSSIAVEQENGVWNAKAPVDGIISGTIKLYHSSKLIDGTMMNEEITNWEEKRDNYGIVTEVIINKSEFENYISKMVYWSCYYVPSFKYDLIIDEYNLVRAQQEQKCNELREIIDFLEARVESEKAHLDEALELKVETQRQFERLMGAAIREGNWQNDDYKDYGKKESIAPMPITSFTLDNLPFDGEIKGYYEEGVNQTKTYYPYIDLTENGIIEKFKDNLDELSLCYEVKLSGVNGQGENKVKTETFTLSAKANLLYSFVKIGGILKPIAFIKDNVAEKYQNQSNVTIKVFVAIVSHKAEVKKDKSGYDYFIFYDKSTPVTIKYDRLNAVYPRIKFEQDNLKTAIDKFVVKCDNKILTKYVDYSLLRRDENLTHAWFLTLRPEVLFAYGNDWNTKLISVTYELSNACTSLYLDALEVMKTNAFPQVSYSLSISKVIPEVYNYLNRIVHITDYELFFDEVCGYISEVEMRLDAPWEDRITTKDYKTKFEDLFSSIVASTEQMKSNGAAYNAAAAAFTSSGTALINEQTLQHSINKYNLTQQFDQGTLTMDNEHGIWATSNEGVVAMTGGGIFCATEKDAAGQWLWHTGLTPVGINASLITTGHIDTNLIHIYSDDNLALQLDRDGLTAYKRVEKDDGSVEYLHNTYVQHNDDGLFFSENDINKVEISWNGFKIRNSTGDEIFYLNDEGNLVLSKAVINNAVINNLDIGEMEQLGKGVNFTAMSSNEFKYNSVLNSYTPNTLTWAITPVYVTPKFDNDDSYTQKVDAFDVYYGYTAPKIKENIKEGMDERYDITGLNWKKLTSKDLLNGTYGIKIDNQHLTVQIEGNKLMNNHEVCYIRIVTNCVQNSDTDKIWIDDKLLTVFALTDGQDGQDAVTCFIESSIGNVIKNGQTENFVLTARLFKGTSEIDTEGNYSYEWKSSYDKDFVRNGKSITLNAQDIKNITTFTCQIEA